MLNPKQVSPIDTSDGGVTATGGTPPFSERFFPDYDYWKMLPVQKKYATFKEYEDGTYSVLDWLDMHIAISHEDRYMKPQSMF